MVKEDGRWVTSFILQDFIGGNVFQPIRDQSEINSLLLVGNNSLNLKMWGHKDDNDLVTSCAGGPWWGWSPFVSFFPSSPSPFARGHKP